MLFCDCTVMNISISFGFLTTINLNLFIIDLSEQGVVIDSRVYCFAIGLTVGAKNACYQQTANPY